MMKALRFFFWTLIIVIAALAALFAYFIYAPSPAAPRLSGELFPRSIEVDGRNRTFLTYAPQGLAEGAPLVVVMHGSDGDAERIRKQTGYGFERLADAEGFAVVYPEAFEGNWNACNAVGDYSANALNIDDVGYLVALVDKLTGEIGVDAHRVFAAGVSRGGHMAFRLALEAPMRFRAVAAVAANLPSAENFKCESAAGGTSSVMIMNGTEDPLNPFNGGEVTLFGLYARGAVRSARESAEFFADLNDVRRAPETSVTRVSDNVRVAIAFWRNEANVEVQLVAIHGGGHVIPQPYVRQPRILGATPREPNGPAVIWEFFERQSPRGAPVQAEQKENGLQ